MQEFYEGSKRSEELLVQVAQRIQSSQIIDIKGPQDFGATKKSLSSTNGDGWGLELVDNQARLLQQRERTIHQ